MVRGRREVVIQYGIRQRLFWLVFAIRTYKSRYIHVTLVTCTQGPISTDQTVHERVSP
jgi:hypothetical protein